MSRIRKYFRFIHFYMCILSSLRIISTAYKLRYMFTRKFCSGLEDIRKENQKNFISYIYK